MKERAIGILSSLCIVAACGGTETGNPLGTGSPVRFESSACKKVASNEGVFQIFQEELERLVHPPDALERPRVSQPLGGPSAGAGSLELAQLLLAHGARSRQKTEPSAESP